MIKGVVPGKYIEYVWTVAGFCEETPTLMLLTSADWAFLAAEVRARQPANAPTPANFSELKVGYLTVANAKTDDQEAVDQANQQAARDIQFSQKKLALISGRGPHH